MKKLFIFIFIIVVVVAGLVSYVYLNRNNLVKQGIEKMMAEATSTSVEVMGSVVSSDMKLIEIEQLRISNPDGYSLPYVADIKDIKAQCDLMGAVLGKGLVCEKIETTVETIYIERTENGKVNIRDLSAVQKDRLEGMEEVSKKNVLLKRVEITFGKIQATEITMAGRNKTEYDLAGKKDVYGYITDTKTLIQISVLKALAAMNRGSMGIPRHLLQKHIMKTTGKV